MQVTVKSAEEIFPNLRRMTAHAWAFPILRNCCADVLWDYSPPHFHALYAGRKAIIDVETLAFIEGQLPASARGIT
jgi:hypothetical protein